MEEKRNTQSRKWQLTINNPIEKGFSHDTIKDIVNNWKAVHYWCMADEIGENGTYHTHIYLYGRSGIRFNTVKKNFDIAHIEMARGTSQENVDYIKKEGKWEKTKKSETSVDGTFEEFGEMPMERQGQRNDIEDLYAMVKNGLSDFEILEQSGAYMLHLEDVQRTRQILINEKYKDTWRDLDITYIYGSTGTGKTRSVMEQYGYSNVYRITDYLHPWDNYKGQDVVIFEEFRSSCKLANMLMWLDGYPVELPCRYANKYACFTKVYIITNIPLEAQYVDIQESNYSSWLAFVRRINKMKHFAGNKVYESKIKLDGVGWKEVDKKELTPFEQLKLEV